MDDKIYHFNGVKLTFDSDMIEQVGSRGARALELSAINVPISPGFIITNASLNEMLQDHATTKKECSDQMARVGHVMGKQFNDPINPLLVKVVESPMLSMVDTFSTVHNVGLCEQTVAGFGTIVGEQFAYREYSNVLRRILQLELSGTVSDSYRSDAEAYSNELEIAFSKEQTMAAIANHRSVFPEEVYQDAYEQMVYVVNVFNRLFTDSDSRQDSCLLVQSMVFGNYGKDSGFGDFYTRNTITGEVGICGKYFENAFDARGKQGISIDQVDVNLFKELQRIGDSIENQFKEIRQIRFTMENGKLWIIEQMPVTQSSAQAEIRSLLDLERRSIVSKEYLVSAIKHRRLRELLHSKIDIESVSRFESITGGMVGASGGAIGRVYFDTESLIKSFKETSRLGKDSNVILAIPATFAEDVKAIEIGCGVISSEGGYASHAPVVARSLGKVALIYPGIKFGDRWMKIDGVRINEGDYVSLDVPYHGEPIIYLGKATLKTPTIESSGLLDVLKIMQGFIGDFDVRVNAEQPKDAQLALVFGAQGIGLCRTEHMFFNKERINWFRSMIIVEDRKERLTIVKSLEDMQAEDFYGLFKVMQGLPVTIRLLDAPLHEFLPHSKSSMDEFVLYYRQLFPDVSEQEIKSRCDLLNEFNPMLGHRGVRIAIAYPELYNMQVRAIFKAAYRLQRVGIEIVPEIMIPLVMSANEIKTIRNGKRIKGKSIIGIHEIEQELHREMGMDRPIQYKVGTMIELPAAALQADTIARYAEFFSFGTNDLTQMTNGLSRDDFNNFFSDYNEFDLLESNPFQILGEQVKELIAIASERGRLVRPDLKLGLCGEHGAEPTNIPFAYEIGLDYVSCSPYGIPIAKLAIAQMNIKNRTNAGDG